MILGGLEGALRLLKTEDQTELIVIQAISQKAAEIRRKLMEDQAIMTANFLGRVLGG